MFNFELINCHSSVIICENSAKNNIGLGDKIMGGEIRRWGEGRLGGTMLNRGTEYECDKCGKGFTAF